MPRELQPLSDETIERIRQKIRSHDYGNPDANRAADNWFTLSDLYHDHQRLERENKKLKEENARLRQRSSH